MGWESGASLSVNLGHGLFFRFGLFGASGTPLCSAAREVDSELGFKVDLRASKINLLNSRQRFADFSTCRAKKSISARRAFLSDTNWASASALEKNPCNRNSPVKMWVSNTDRATLSRFSSGSRFRISGKLAELSRLPSVFGEADFI
jgi:hypothetical protein